MEHSLQKKVEKTCVLIVEDDEAHRYVFETLLESEGYGVQTANDGREALERASENPPDIVISDILMPKMDGYELCKAWKIDRRLKNIPFIFYTATFANPKGERLASDLGADLFLNKPQDPLELLEQLKEFDQIRRAGGNPVRKPIEDRQRIERTHSGVLLKKLEQKIRKLDEANSKLESELERRREVEKALRTSESLFEAIVSDQTEFIVRWSMEGVPTFANRAYCDLHGASGNNLSGKKFVSNVDESDWRRLAEVKGNLSPGSPVASSEIKIVLSDGKVVWIHWKDRAIFDEEGELLSYQSVGRDITIRKTTEIQLDEAFKEIKSLKERLEIENVYLKDEIRDKAETTEMIGTSRSLDSVRADIRKVAKTDANVLIFGETGTGKELVAREIHSQSDRKNKSLVSVNCSAIPVDLFESELFGRVKGAYTGATDSKAGRFEVADGSTLFLDEVGELPLPVQAKLLRVLQEGRFERLGSAESVSVDVRIIAATNRDLRKGVAEKQFREDLYYRLNVFPLKIPPLRERIEDIPMLIDAFVRELGRKFGKIVKNVDPQSVDALLAYPWPGNIRELRNVVERSLIQSDGPELFIEYPIPLADSSGSSSRLEDVEREHIIRILDRVQWRVRGKGGAAELLDLKPTTLESRMRKWEIARPHHG